MTDSHPVWYVSYGSNMYRERFLAYIRGGTPTGSQRTYRGCRNPCTPTATAQLHLPGGVFYAGHAAVWGGGGSAFYDPTLPGRTLARAWLITTDQFTDILTQECGGEPTRQRITLNWEQLHRHGTVTVPGLYGQVVLAGQADNTPVATFTGPFTFADSATGTAHIDGRPIRPNAPSSAYTAMLNGGYDEMQRLALPTLNLTARHTSAA